MRNKTIITINIVAMALGMIAVSLETGRLMPSIILALNGLVAGYHLHKYLLEGKGGNDQ